MKRIFILFLFLFSFSVQSQELSPQAKSLKDSKTETYNAVKNFAINKWEDDHDMIVYEINKQTESLFEALKLSESNMSIFSKALNKWGDNINAENVLKNSTIDWSMVTYEMKKQIKAKNAY